MRRVKARRMGKYDSAPQAAWSGEVVISARDNRLMQRVLRAAMACQKGHPGVYGRMALTQKLFAALDAFNAKRKS